MQQLKTLFSLAIAALVLSCGGTSFQLCQLKDTCPPPPPDAGMPLGCADDSACVAPAGRCLVAEQRCVACLTDEDCPAGVCETANHTCALLPDTCTTAAPVTLSPGSTIEVKGDTTRAADDTSLSCALPGSGGGDLVYTFVIESPVHLIATATATSGSLLQPVLGLRTTCGSLTSIDNVACAYGGGSAGAQLSADLVPGPYWLWLDGESGSSGAFKLELQLQKTSQTDSCAQPTALVFSANKAEATGDTRGHTDDSGGHCGGSGAADVVYTFSLAQPQSAHIVLAPSGLYAPVVYLRGSDCTDTTLAAQLWCGSAQSGQNIDVVLPRLGAGDYHLFVDGAQATGDSAAGPFHLTVTLDAPVPPPANDDCQMPEGLPVPSSGIGSFVVHGDTTAANNDALGCMGSGPDVVYSLALTVPARVGVKVTPASGSPLRPSVYVRQVGACQSEDPADELGCQWAPQVSSAATLQIPSLPAGEYSVWVDGVEGTGGAFDMNVDLTTAPLPPSNDVCSGAVPLMLASGPVTVQGTTVSAHDDALLSCTLPIAGYSPDVVYLVDVPSTLSLAIDISAAQGSALKPVFGIRAPGACDSNDYLDELACVWGDPKLQGRTVVTLPSVPPGQYALWVEGDDATQGDFSLRVTSGPEVQRPMNDSCGLSTTILPTLSANTPAPGDTRAADNDGEGGCGFAYGENGEYAPDVVYTLKLNAPQTVTLTVTPDATMGALFRPLVYVRETGQCGPTATPIACQVATNMGDPVSVTLPALAAGTYNVWVDGAGLSSGSFSIRLQ